MDWRELIQPLVEARKAAGLSTTQIAAAMGTSAGAVAQVEQGVREPRISTLIRYAETVGYNIEVRAAE